MKMGLGWKPLNQHKRLLRKQTQESYSHDKGEISGYKAEKYSTGQKSIWQKTTFKLFLSVDKSKFFGNA